MGSRGRVVEWSRKWGRGVELLGGKNGLSATNGNNKKSLGRDSKGGIIILPPVSFEEHVVFQREIKARTLLLQSLPEDHMAD
nr:hypothetical protein [Tanacetum cinerariifolium]